jgi:hypothetical protein
MAASPLFHALGSPDVTYCPGQIDSCRPAASQEANIYRGSSRLFKVVRDSEDILSIWHADAEEDPVWSEVGFRGTAAQCLRFLEDEESANGFLFLFPAG